MITGCDVPMDACAGTLILVRFDMGFYVILSNVERYVEIVTTSSEISVQDSLKFPGLTTHDAMGSDTQPKATTLNISNHLTKNGRWDGGKS